jgi:DnaK suppressor protein
MTRTAAYPLSPRTLESLRRTLLAQRDFRREQLSQLDRQRCGRALSGAHREVYVSLAVGARTALQDAQSALLRIEQGRFGRCITCGTDLELEVLETLPQTARCLACQRATLAADLRS